VINEDGSIYIQPAYKSLYWVTGGVWIANDGTLLIDGKPCYKRKVEQYMMPVGVKIADGSFLVECDDGMWRNFSSEGKVLCESKNQLGASYGTSIAYLDEQSGKWGLMNYETGEILIKPKYSSVWGFNRVGMTKASEEHKNGKRTYDIIRADGKVLVSRSKELPWEEHHMYQLDNHYIGVNGKKILNRKKYTSTYAAYNGYIEAEKKKKTSSGIVRTSYLYDSAGNLVWEQENCRLALNKFFPQIGTYKISNRSKLLYIDDQGIVHDGISLPNSASDSEVFRLDERYLQLSSGKNEDLPFKSVILDTENDCIAGEMVYSSINQPVFGPDKLAVVIQGEYKRWNTNSAYTWKVITYGEKGFERVLYTAPDLSAEPIVLQFPAASEQPVQHEIGNR